MPATEQTWYDQRLLHIVFGFTAITMLLSTVWMFAADHDREWKGYQRKFRNAEQRLTQWRIDDQQSSDKLAETQESEAALIDAQLTPPSQQLYEAFKSEIHLDSDRREQAQYDFGEIDADYAALQTVSAEAAAARQALADAKQDAKRGWEAVIAAQTAVNEAQNAASDVRTAADLGLEEANTAHQQRDKQVSNLTDVAAESVAHALMARDKFFGQLSRLVDKARGREDDLLSRRKFKSADLDKAKADLDILVRDEATAEVMAEAQEIIDDIKTKPGGLDDLTLQRQAATAHRKNLQTILAAMRSDETDLKSRLAESRAEFDRLTSSFEGHRATYFTRNFPFLGKRWLELPILDAFNSPLKIDNLWTDNLTIAYGSFGEVRRFDRCTTCHKGIQTSAAGSAVDPAYVPEMEIELIVQTPETAPQPAVSEQSLSLEQVYGIRLADQGLVDDDDVTVSFVAPLSLAATTQAVVAAEHPAASPGFQVGDVLLFVNGDKVLEPKDAAQFMIDGATWGEPMTVTVRRGLPQPFTSHPRLDLFVGSLSPHKMNIFACTSCHEGQGSATAFAYASHTPNSTSQATEWASEHGWFNNHHWIFPMYPKRFTESACIRCHHDVTELEPSERFPEPPAPNVVLGYQLVQDYGCFGCHEINGYNGPDQRIGPDLRLEPNYFAAAATVKADPAFANLDETVQSWVTTLITEPFRDHLRRKLLDFLTSDAASDTPKLGGQRAHRMVEVLQAQDTPGTMRRAGPSLRHVGSKLGAEFMNSWIREPKQFRPTTKMPQFFGLWDHLVDESDRQMAEDFEQVEIQCITEYLLNHSEPFQDTEQDPDAELGSVQRGKVAFEIRGCLACHAHDDFPEIAATQGPDLTGFGDKLSPEVGAPNPQAWLYTWLKNPSNYHARTKMPDLQLTSEENAQGQLIDPAADITAYLLSSTRDWSPAAAANVPFDPLALNTLCMDYLTVAFPRRDAENYLQNGIPEEMASSLKGAEVELVGGASDQQKKMYIGRKSITKHGCHGCHDIPGFETAKTIGTALADWGTKEPSKLAFEHIAEYLHRGHGGRHDSSHEGGHDDGLGAAHEGDRSQNDAEDPLERDGAHLATDHQPEGKAIESPEDVAFYESQIEAHERLGFIWQKLREPRSYDYKKTANKRYNERLRMPLFPLDAQEREAVITFVLGLVATPPAEQFVYAGDPHRNAITDGLAVLETYNCAGCHVLRPETWTLEFNPGEITAPESPPDFPFLAVDVPESQLEASTKADPYRGFLSAHLQGMPAISNDDASLEIWDEDWEPIDPEEIDDYAADELVYPFQLWRSATVEGEVFDVGARVAVPAGAIKSRLPSHGGDLAKYLLSRVTELEKKDNPNANGTESWGWVPPPLIGEGAKVQPGWLHNFLLDPFTIRPAVFLRMPKFNMSPDEATKLVNYFAAVDNVDFPFELDQRMRHTHLAETEERFKGGSNGENRLDHAMKIVTNSNYCVKCHLVGDFIPEGSIRALSPNLAAVQNRLRPEYMRRWIANPLKSLPYTPMPVNITFKPDDPHLGGVEQDLFPGTSIEQLDGLIDLLTHYGEYMSQKNNVSELVRQAAPAAPATDPEPDDQAAAPETPPRTGRTSQLPLRARRQ